MTRMQEIIDTAGRAARELWLRGWAERNAGNLSYRLSPEDLSGTELREEPWRDLGAHLPDVAGRCFLLTATGSFFRELERATDRDLGVIEVEENGSRYRTLCGYRDGGGPTSELLPHLRAHAARIRTGQDEDRAVLHTHPTNLIALTYAIPLTTHTLTRLLWEMHTECIVVFPRGCGFLDWRLPGSEDQARATEEVFEERTMAIWQHHGAVALGADFETAFGLIETAEKAAEIYLKAAALGPVSQRLTTAQLTSLAQKFGVEPDPEILGGGG
ncbi:rhamnulose-1-phosphate aldolase [Gemmatimonadota bacterium]